MDFWLIAYILVCVVVGGYAVSTLYKRSQTIGAMISLVLLIAIFAFYGLRWFQGGSLKGTTKDGKTPWPPIVNMCPDFMVTHKDNTKIYCYDAGNVYGLKTATGVTGITTGLTINGISGQSAFLIKDPGASKDARTTMKQNIENILSDSSANRIRWEGAWDGQRVDQDKIPNP